MGVRLVTGSCSKLVVAESSTGLCVMIDELTDHDGRSYGIVAVAGHDHLIYCTFFTNLVWIPSFLFDFYTIFYSGMYFHFYISFKDNNF